MRNRLLLIGAIVVVSVGLAATSAYGATFAEKLKGRILLQVQAKGEAWYVDPTTLKRTYLRDGDSAYQLLREKGLGITNINLMKIPIGLEPRIVAADSDGDGLPDNLEEAIGTDSSDTDTDHDGFTDGQEVQSGYNPLGNGRSSSDVRLVVRLKGRVLLQTESRGQAWYVNPADGKRYYLANGEMAYQVMRYLGLGMSNNDLTKVAIEPQLETPINHAPVKKRSFKEIGKEFSAVETYANVGGKLAFSARKETDKSTVIVLWDGQEVGSYKTPAYVHIFDVGGKPAIWPTLNEYSEGANIYLDGKKLGEQYSIVKNPRSVNGKLAYVGWYQLPGADYPNSLINYDGREYGKSCVLADEPFELEGKLAFLCAGRSWTNPVVVQVQDDETEVKLTHALDTGIVADASGKPVYIPRNVEHLAIGGKTVFVSGAAIVNGKLVYITYDVVKNKHHLFYDGKEIAMPYDRITSLASVNNKIAYIGIRNNRAYVVYDGQEYGTEYHYVFDRKDGLDIDYTIAFFIPIYNLGEVNRKLVFLVSDQNSGKNFLVLEE